MRAAACGQISVNDQLFQQSSSLSKDHGRFSFDTGCERLGKVRLQSFLGLIYGSHNMWSNVRQRSTVLTVFKSVLDWIKTFLTKANFSYRKVIFGLVQNHLNKTQISTLLCKVPIQISRKNFVTSVDG